MIRRVRKKVVPLFINKEIASLRKFHTKNQSVILTPEPPMKKGFYIINAKSL